MDTDRGLVGSLLGAALGSGTAGQSASPLADLLGGLAGGNQAQAGSLLSVVMQLLADKGGLQAVLGALQQSGLGDQASSWVGSGPNAAITQENVQQVFGADTLAHIASQLGLSEAQAGTALAQILPEVVNQLTPKGQVPADADDQIATALAALAGGR